MIDNQDLKVCYRSSPELTVLNSVPGRARMLVAALAAAVARVSSRESDRHTGGHSIGHCKDDEKY
jgi:hypothetical protein